LRLRLRLDEPHDEDDHHHSLHPRTLTTDQNRCTPRGARRVSGAVANHGAPTQGRDRSDVEPEVAGA